MSRRAATVTAGLSSLLALGASTGCPGEHLTIEYVDGEAPSACAAGFLGEPGAPPLVELRALRADGVDVALRDGDDLAVLLPPQGGRVAFVGVRALNLDGCGLQIVAALRDPTSRQVRLDGRTVNLRREPDGWGTTGRGTSVDISLSDEIGDYSNVPLCPNQWADQDVFDRPFELEVELVDRSRKTIATRSIVVTPRCAEPGERELACKCLCRDGYVLGERCGEDAGVEGGAR